jgi:hypothetical protein
MPAAGTTIPARGAPTGRPVEGGEWPWPVLAIRWPLDGPDAPAGRWLEWRVTTCGAPGSTRATAVLVGPESHRERVVVAAAAAVTTLDGASGLAHVDVPGCLSATLRLPAGASAGVLVYARTSLLGSLGAPGGRADRPDLVLAGACGGRPER